MKQRDTSSKKIIKNLVSLVASALILVAATFAWFASNDSVAVDSVSADTQANFIVDYYATTIPDTDILWGMQDGELYVKNSESAVDTMLSEYVQSIDSEAWYRTSAPTIPLIPGEFRVFKISFQSRISHDYKVNLSDVAIVSDDPSAVAQSIYTYGFSVRTNEETGIATASSTETLHSVLFSDGAYGTKGLVHTVHTEIGDAVEVYFVVGIPGEDINNTHDSAREAGAQISIGSIDVE